MKRLILAVLMAVMVATPCFAQEDGESLFFLEGTLWWCLYVGFESGYLPSPPPSPIWGTGYLGFHQGMLYKCVRPPLEELDCTGPYGTSNMICSPLGCFEFDINTGDYGIGFESFLPIGIGVQAYTGCDECCMSYISIFILINANWTPPDVEQSASRNEFKRSDKTIYPTIIQNISDYNYSSRTG